MSDKPYDTPFNEFSDEEISEMSNNEMMDRGVALHELGLDGWIDEIINMAVTSIAEMLVASRIATEIDGRDPRQTALDLHAMVGQVMHNLFDVGRNVGQRQERGEL